MQWRGGASRAGGCVQCALPPAVYAMRPDPTAPAAPGDDTPRLVWDLPLRLAHWGLALAVCGSFITDWIGPAAFLAHVVCGSTALVLVLFRVAWGFVGPAHARFTDFVRAPRAVLASLPGLTRAAYRRLAGHTPLGGWMALVLLALVAVQAGLGLFANDEISHTGPLYGYVDGRLSNRLSAWHVRIAYTILGAVALHVGAALYYRVALGEDLVRPLFSGYKRGVGAAAAIERQRPMLALVIVAILAALLVWLIRTAPDAALEL
jgi:cytochrome b